MGDQAESRGDTRADGRYGHSQRRLKIQNPEPEPQACPHGWHPGFCVACDEGVPARLEPVASWGFRASIAGFRVTITFMPSPLLGKAGSSIAGGMWTLLVFGFVMWGVR